METAPNDFVDEPTNKPGPDIINSHSTIPAKSYNIINVTVSLIKTPTDVENADFTVSFEATPVAQ